MNRMLISAAHKSSGKTMVSIGLCAALRKQGHAVQPFKKGPDYIDPMWLSLAAGRACRNLDLYLMEREDILATFARHSAEVNLVEGNKGLYDGLALDGSNSNAALAKLLDLPVFLVIDARGMTRGIAPLILGYQAFDPSIRIAGVILNNLGGARHEQKLRAVIAHYTAVEVIGAVPHAARIARDHFALQAAEAALRAVYGGRPLIVRMGGTVPVAENFKRLMGLGTVDFACSTGDEDFHAPNEFFRLHRLHEGLAAWVRLWDILGERWA